MSEFYRKHKDNLLLTGSILFLVGMLVFSMFMWKVMLNWQKQGILKAIPKPTIQAAEQPVVVKGEYTLIYKASIPTYIKEHYLEDGRI